MSSGARVLDPVPLGPLTLKAARHCSDLSAESFHHLVHGRLRNMELLSCGFKPRPKLRVLLLMAKQHIARLLLEAFKLHIFGSKLHILGLELCPHLLPEDVKLHILGLKLHPLGTNLLRQALHLKLGDLLGRHEKVEVEVAQ